MRKLISLFQLQNLPEKKSILIQIIWIVLIVLSFSFITAMFVQSEYIPRYSLILVLLWAVSMFLIQLTKKGNCQITAALYISFLLLMIFAFSFNAGGIKSHGMKILPIVVLFAGLTMGEKEIWVFGIIAAIGGFILVVAEYHNLILTQPIGSSPLINWIFITTSIFLLCFFENLSVEKLRKSLAKAQEELELRKKSEAMLQLKNEKLMEISQFQSHIVRSPIASVLGLIELINHEIPNDPENLIVIQNLKIAAVKLDDVVHKIVRKTAEIDETTKTPRESDL